LIEHCNAIELPGDEHDLLMGDIRGSSLSTSAAVLLFGVAA
jgi:hypothetical protein